MTGRSGKHGQTTQAPPRPARPPKRSAVVAGQIRASIIMQRLRPGDALPIERAMIAAYGVSRATIREALRELEVQGLIQLRTGPKGGPVVAASGAREAIQSIRNFYYFEAATIQNIYELRSMIEVQAVRSVIGHVDAATFSQLEALIDISSRPAGDVDGRRQQREAEFAFHTVLASASPNPLLSLMVEVLAELLVSATARESADHELHGAWCEENCGFHGRIVEAVRNRDGDQAAALMRKHMDSAHEHLRLIYGSLTLEDIALNPRDRP
ncbi:FadR/GntR family transcriptional regulator [uncultured Jannaschia sp.]|uniref:FadR/GntR family transcriptional regulator n=1 Tax=uncultured Jannaschia sp. TaxID=293347 RepID=UPI002610B2DD|nr:FCD domain-containing protein [uncultured Jannaschia sp.]